MKLKTIYLVCFSVIWGMTSCVSDDSTFNNIDTYSLSITGMDNDAMMIYNFNLGDECLITPEVLYEGNKADLKYEWSIGTYKDGIKGDLDVVSDQPVLNHKFTEGGIYYAHLKVTDGKVGQVVEYQININRTFEHGYFLVSNDENGKPNLAFVKVMTPEETESGMEQVYMENCIERMNGNVTMTGLVDCALQTQDYEDWRLGKFTRLLIITENQCVFLDPNTLSILSSLKYEETTNGFSTTRFVRDVYSPYFFDAHEGKYLHLNAEYMYLYEKSEYTGNVFDDYFVYPYLNWGSFYYSASFADYGKDEAYEYNAYYYYYGLPSPFVSTGGMLVGQDLITNFMGAKEGYSYPTFLLARSKDSNIGYLYKFPSGIANGATYPPTTVSFTLSSETALPEEGERLYLSTTYNRHYYKLDNKIYVALVGNAQPFPTKNEYALSFSDSEIITFMDLDISTEEIYVATYDVTKKRGNFYIYDAKDVRTDNQGKVSPKAVHKDCADKIVSILYKKSV